MCHSGLTATDESLKASAEVLGTWYPQLSHGQDANVS